MLAVQTQLDPLTASTSEDLKLIADLLAEDLQDQQTLQQAQAIQLALALSDSRPGSPIIPPAALPAEEDHINSLRLALNETHSALSKVKMEEIEDELERERARNVRDEAMARQMALKFEAEARKEMLDREMARALQKMDEDGADILAAGDAEAILGADRVRLLVTARTPRPPVVTGGWHSLPAKPPSASGSSSSRAMNPSTPSFDFKSKGKESSTPPPPPVVHPTCNICMDPTQLTAHPYNASLSANSSGRVQFGLVVGDPALKHIYCIGCLTTYIKTKLEDETPRKVFPIRCPECTLELTDDIARRVLGDDHMERWHYRMLLDSTPNLFCPNARCSVRVIKNEDGNPQAQCPSCKYVMCTECEVQWHQGKTCRQFKLLPEHERDPEDWALLALAKKEGWHRCPECKAVVELTAGCYHITCICGKHWCYLCGSAWDITRTRCLNPRGPCRLWDEEQLIEDPHQQARQALRNAHQQPHHQQPPPQRQDMNPPNPPRRAMPWDNPAPPAAQNRGQNFGMAPPPPARNQNIQHFHAPALPQRDLPHFIPAHPQAGGHHVPHFDHHEQMRQEMAMDVDRRARDQRANKRRANMSSLDWMHNKRTSSHPFTMGFLDRTCGYCGNHFNRLIDLQQHLATIENHHVSLVAESSSVSNLTTVNIWILSLIITIRWRLESSRMGDFAGWVRYLRF